MSKSLIVVISIILSIVLIGGTCFYFYNVKRDDALTLEESFICDAFIASLRGDSSLDSFEVSDDIKDIFLDYQSENTIPNDTPILLLENVSDFNAYIILRDSYFKTLASMDISEGEDVILSTEVEEFINSFEANEYYDSIIAMDTLETTNVHVYEKDNNYYINYGSVFFDEYGQMLIEHKGFSKALFEKDYNQMSFKKRALLKPSVIDRYADGNTVMYLISGTGSLDKVLVMTRGSNSIVSVSIEDRSIFPVMP